MSGNLLARLLSVALLALVLAWQLWLLPPEQAPRWLAASLHALPLLPAVLLLLRGRRSAAFYGALAALVLFCHGISEAWTTPQARALAGVEVVLCVALVFAASWDGLRARARRRRPAD